MSGFTQMLNHLAASQESHMNSSKRVNKMQLICFNCICKSYFNPDQCLAPPLGGSENNTLPFAKIQYC